MNTLRNYLDNMFYQLPNIPEVSKAKEELWQMMEDKFQELVAEGKSEQEAIDIVIEEFGNLEELAEELGIGKLPENYRPYNPNTQYNVPNGGVAVPQSKPDREVSLDEAQNLMGIRKKRAVRLALAVMLFIITLVPAIITDHVVITYKIGIDLDELTGAIYFLACLVAIVLIIVSAIPMKAWKEIKGKNVLLDEKASMWVSEEYSAFSKTYGTFMAIGIALFILCFEPAIIEWIFGGLGMKSYFISHYEISAAIMVLMIAVGVFMVVMVNSIDNGYALLWKHSKKEFVKDKRKSAGLPIGISAVICVLIIIVSVIMGAVLNGIYIGPDGEESRSHEEEVTVVENEEFSSIDVSAEFADIQISVGDSYSVKYVSSFGLGVDVENSGSCLNITQSDDSFSWFDFNSFDNTIYVTVPEDATLENININTETGNIKIIGITSADLDIKSDVGNVNINDASFKDCDINVDTGNVSCDNNNFERISITEDVGNTYLSYDKNQVYGFDLSTDMGKLKLDGNSVSSFVKDGDNNHMISIVSDVGNITVEGK